MVTGNVDATKTGGYQNGACPVTGGLGIDAHGKVYNQMR
jgi:hypothetical protein